MINNPNKYHTILGCYFQSKPLYLDVEKIKRPNARKLVEGPWQLSEAGEYDKLKTCLIDIEYLYLILQHNEMEAVRYWRKLSELYSMNNEYTKVIDNVNFNEKPDDISKYLYALSAFLQMIGSHRTAVKSLQSVLKYDEEIFGENSPNVVRDLSSLSLELLRIEPTLETEELFIRVVDKLRNLSSANALDMATALNNLGLFYSSTGQQDRGKRCYQEAMEILEHSGNAVSLTLAMLHYNMSDDCSTYEAIPMLRNALHIVEKSYGRNHPQTGMYINKLASRLVEIRPVEAMKLAKEALENCINVYGKDHQSCIDSMLIIASLYYNSYQNVDAEKILRKALTIENQSETPQKVRIADVSERLATVLNRVEKTDEAKFLYEEALAFWSNKPAYISKAEQIRQKLTQFD